MPHGCIYYVPPMENLIYIYYINWMTSLIYLTTLCTQLFSMCLKIPGKSKFFPSRKQREHFVLKYMYFWNVIDSGRLWPGYHYLLESECLLFQDFDHITATPRDFLMVRVGLLFGFTFIDIYQEFIEKFGILLGTVGKLSHYYDKLILFET